MNSGDRRGKFGKFRGHRGNFRNRPYGRGGRRFDRDSKNEPREPRASNSTQPQFNTEVLKESEIGVTEYVSKATEGFSGIIKARYSDFHVNEIHLNGTIAKLTDLSVPKDNIVNDFENNDSIEQKPCELVPIEIWTKIESMLEEKSDSTFLSGFVEIDVSDKSKDERTKIHQAIKQKFGGKVIGSTIDRDNIKYIRLVKYTKNIRVDHRKQWPKDRGGEYVHFVVFKEHFDTMETAMRIAEALRMKPSMLTYAGTKDRRAITTQWFSIKKVEPEILAAKCKKLYNISIGNFNYQKEPLKLGQLKGNRFRIALRNVTGSDELINKSVGLLSNNGFLNYYGLQRFGNSAEIPTYKIGKELLKGNWMEACNLILKPRTFEMDRMVGQAKKIYLDTGDTKKALFELGSSRDRTIEGKLLQGLENHHENDLVNALEYVPRNMRLLYIHAYQSFIWNTILSRRVKEFGLTPIAGDLVQIEPTEPVEVVPEENCIDSAEEITDKKHIKVKVITEDDLSNYTIYDIVLPLPGFDVTYPDNIQKEWYRELLEKDGLDLEMTKQKVRTYCVSGSYRKCVERADNLTWQIMKYNNPHDSLIRSDLEELNNKPAPVNIEDGEYKALILDFCLPSSSYATMALREILKTDTSTASQAKLNDYHNEAKRKTETDESNLTKKVKLVEDLPTPPPKQEIIHIDEQKNIE